ncbi:MAG TPA: hypothetical protein V6D33_11035 [Cyanophyceae cyanobacterium]
MPTKGTHKLNPQPTPSTHLKIPLTLYEGLERLGKVNGIINPRNGQGNRTRVIERLFAQLPVLGRAKVAIQMLLEGHPQGQEYAESVLIELEELEIEQAYEEARIEGALPEPKSGAWIV